MGLGESSVWTSHGTPKATSVKAPKSPELHLEPLNCTTISVKWQRDAEDTAAVQGYKLFYKEEGQQENGPIFLDTSDLLYTLSGLDPRRKYHVRLLAYGNVGDGYQADQTVSTPGCVSVRDRMVPPPPPPHHLCAKANTSSSIFLHWRRPALPTAQAINYTIRCNPVGLQNASLVQYLQTSETHMMVQDLKPNTKYEFAVRLYVDQLSSPWSPVVYHSTLPEAPAGPPVGVKVTLIEDDTALVSWKPPDGPETVVTRYTILYASRKAWIAGEWQVLHREGRNASIQRTSLYSSHHRVEEIGIFTSNHVVLIKNLPLCPAKFSSVVRESLHPVSGAYRINHGCALSGDSASGAAGSRGARTDHLSRASVCQQLSSVDSRSHPATLHFSGGKTLEVHPGNCLTSSLCPPVARG